MPIFCKSSVCDYFLHISQHFEFNTPILLTFFCKNIYKIATLTPEWMSGLLFLATSITFLTSCCDLNCPHFGRMFSENIYSISVTLEMTVVIKIAQNEA
jgi:hypothetical protein